MAAQSDADETKYGCYSFWHYSLKKLKNQMFKSKQPSSHVPICEYMRVFPVLVQERAF
jgi:hypothetical protein